MKFSTHALKGLYKKPWAWIALGVAGVGVILIYQAGAKAPQSLVSVSKGSVIQEVSVSGKVSSSEELELSFERSGKVSRVYKSVGSRVRAGETIAVLSSGDLAARLASAEASVDAAIARLDELKRGARPEELAIKETAVSEAKLALVKIYSGSFNTIESSYISAEDAVRKQTDAFFTRDEDLNPSLTFQTSDIQAQLDVESGRFKMSKELADWKMEMALLGPTSPSGDLEAELSRSEAHLLSIQNFLKRLGDVLVRQGNLTPAQLTSYQTSLTTARTQISAALSNIALLKQNIAGQLLVIEQAENSLRLAKAGSSAEAIRAQEAQVASARANVMDMEAEIGKTIVRAPIGGVITKQEAKLGQTVMAQTPVIGMISDAKFEIEANVPEIEIGEVKVGNKAKIKFDAFPGEEFEGVVTSIDPAETVIGGVVNFKVKLAFVDEDPRIKSGFTADIDIETSRKDDVLLLPQHVIMKDGDMQYVLKLESGKQVRSPISAGLKGRSGMIEVVSGVSEGDVVLENK